MTAKLRHVVGIESDEKPRITLQTIVLHEIYVTKPFSEMRQRIQEQLLFLTLFG